MKKSKRQEKKKICTVFFQTYNNIFKSLKSRLASVDNVVGIVERRVERIGCCFKTVKQQKNLHISTIRKC